MYPKCSLSDSNIFLQIVGLLSLVIIMIIAWFYYMRVCHDSITEKYDEINTNTIKNVTQMETGDRSTFPKDKYPGRRPELVSTLATQIPDTLRKETLKTLQPNDKYTLRDCKVYFTDKENIGACDAQSDDVPTKTCSYKFDGWMEFETYTDKNGQTIEYPKKTYEPNASNTGELINSYFTSKCFKEFSSEGQGSAQNFQHRENALVKYDSKGDKNNTELDTNIFGGKRYTSMQFLNVSNSTDNLGNILDSICSVKYDTIPSLRNRVFYKFVLNDNKVIQNIIKVTLNTDQTIFTEVPNSRALQGFANLGSYGLRFSAGKNDKLEVFVKKATAKPANVKVYKFTYLSYLCEDSQIKISTITPLIIDANRFLNFGSSTNTDVIPLTSINSTIDTTLLSASFTKNEAALYQGEDGYADAIINKLRDKIAEKEGAISSTAKTELDTLISKKNTKQGEIDGLELQKNSYSPSDGDRSFNGILNITKNGTKLFNYEQGFKNKILGEGFSISSGGTVTSVSSTDICITYSNVGSFTFTVPASGYTCDILIVGGGGGGGFDGSGGGGGGEVKYYTDSSSSFKTSGSLNFKQGIYTINVGAGGGRGQNIYASGANGSSSSIVSTNSATDWTVCAGEGGQCSCPNGVVRYGANGRYATTRDVSTSIGCNNGVFGDPIYGIVKKCECKTQTTNLISQGGGGGGSRNSYGVAAGGGGGGGGHGPEANYVGAASSGSGGKGGNPNIRYTGGGGGGGANVGNKNGVDGSGKAGQGGTGVYIDINGSSVGYGGGGGGGTYIQTDKVFGTEGGGDGATQYVNTNTDGKANTGGGAGSGGHAGISGPYGGNGGSGIVIIRIKNFFSLPSITNDTDALYNSAKDTTLTLPQNIFQAHIITAFIFLQPGYYRFKADIGENGDSVNPNIKYGELMIYDESHKNNLGIYNGRTVFKYTDQSNQLKPGYLRPYIYIPKSKFFKLAYRYISYNTTNTTNFTDSGFIVKYKYSPTEPPKDEAIVVNITSSPSVNSFTIGNRDKIMTFVYTSDNTGQGQTQYNLNVPENFTADILMVGGGGAGGYNAGAGGGGGGVVMGYGISLKQGSYNIKVGAGGVPRSPDNTSTFNGYDSSITYNGNTIVAKGGGGGVASYLNGAEGGSGGGGASWPGDSTSARSNQPTVQSVPEFGTFFGYGNPGGRGRGKEAGGMERASAGGGGAGSAGYNSGDYPLNDMSSGARTNVGGRGGDGRLSAISGSVIYYGGGGGGSSHYSGNAGPGGIGGGGNGGTARCDGRGKGEDGKNGTGGGGGGGAGCGSWGGNGGSGIVIIRYNRQNQSIANIPASIRLSDVTINNDDGSYSSDNIAAINTPANNYVLTGTQLYSHYKSTDLTIMNIFSTINYNNNSYPGNYQGLSTYLGTDAVDFYNVKTKKKEKGEIEKSIVDKTAERDLDLNANTTIVNLRSLLNSILRINYSSLITLGIPTLKPNFNISATSAAIDAIPATATSPAQPAQPAFSALFNDDCLTYEKITKADLLNSVNKKDILTPNLSKFTKSIYIESLD